MTRRLSPKNRTNVRLEIIRAGFRLLARVAPAEAERRALDLFFRPARLHGTPPGARGYRFTATEHELAMWEWGAGPTILLAHGWNGAATQMAGFAEPLVRAGYNVVAFDQPAHGASAGTETNVLEMRDVLLSLARKLAPVHAVIGHSFGGTAAVLALAAGLAVERMVLIAPPVDLTAYPRRFAEQLGLSALTPALMAGVERRVGKPFGEIDLRAVASRLATPMLLIHDPDDREVPFTHGAELAEAWPGARLERRRGVGHRRVLADADAIASVVSFVQGATPSRRETDVAGDAVA